MIRAAGELDCFSAHIRLRELGKIEDKADELKQHDGLEFDYSTTAVESSWEPRGVLQPEQKIEDSTKDE
ncbi:hypothetical protein B296_00045437 [Ensete ventricosum]|uniref:Uncharacterized protein n=1 Tax=Ensete ventricosum TaxID=4639 RepID=A0A426YHY4_ENSVE|nr:hypothetical protein B296_00045437 [Ensete ventricosum]